MPRYSATFRFDALDHAHARSFGRDIRREARVRSSHSGSAWDEKNARLLRVSEPDADHRATATVKFDALDLSAAKTFARWLRRRARQVDGYDDRQTKLLRVTEPVAHSAPVSEDEGE